ncbi:MAG: alpha-ketoacid dehydrogenase subunit beta, partial [Candidatus Binatia bacterium]
MADQTYLDAIRSALDEEMMRDSSVYLFGEDVAVGGPFGVTLGLAEKCGNNRVVNTPISEGAVMGL